ncbi:MAG: MMPL family transporter [Demequinaceae bacterium]|nr:MMPL family transporter [Demequinaceae bacterium]
MRIFTRIARLIVRRPIVVIVTWATVTAGSLVLAFAGVGDGGLLQRVDMGAPSIPGSDSDIAAQFSAGAVQPGNGTSLTTAVVGLSPFDPVVAAAFVPGVLAMSGTDGVGVVISPSGITPGVDALSLPQSSATVNPGSLVASDGTGFVIIVRFAELDDEAATYRAHAAVEAIVDSTLAYLRSEVFPGFSDADPRAYTFSVPLLLHDFEGLVEHDLIRGELVAVPIALVVMVLVFGGFLAASTPIAGALASIASGLAALFALSYPMNLNSAAINIVSILGVGLSIDYGLLIVSRYREELFHLQPKGGTRESRAAALERTMMSAGRTVFYSGLIVALSVGGMLTFNTEMMRGFGAAGLAIVVLALATALTLVPAVAFAFGAKIGRPSPLRRIRALKFILHHTANVSRDEGPLASLAAWIQKRRWFTLASTLVLVLILAAPVLAFIPRNSEVELLPADFERREFLDVMHDSFPALAEPDILVVSEGTPGELDVWLADAADIEGVRGFSPALERDGMSVAGISIVESDPGGPEAVAVVEDLRAMDAPFRVYVGGQAAGLLDFSNAVATSGLIGLGIVILAVVALLFLMTGSLLMPIKALIVNALSLAATLGVLVWIFQYGNLSGILGFDPPGGIEIYVVIVLVCFGFGLAMDYEVFLLSRIKELVDQGMSDDEAVRVGLQRSGRIITSAAAVIVLVFIGFAFGDLLIIKEVGFGLAVAVLLDATLVRLLLVPATMSLLGKWNWWAPAPLRRLHERFSLTH